MPCLVLFRVDDPSATPKGASFCLGARTCLERWLGRTSQRRRPISVVLLGLSLCVQPCSVDVIAVPCFFKLFLLSIWTGCAERCLSHLNVLRNHRSSSRRTNAKDHPLPKKHNCQCLGSNFPPAALDTPFKSPHQTRCHPPEPHHPLTLTHNLRRRAKPHLKSEGPFPSTHGVRTSWAVRRCVRS